MEIYSNQLFAGRYRLLEKRGRGSFGEVWLAKDEQLGMEVAVKIYIALDSRGVEDFKSEFKYTYELNHPNLLHATYFDVCQGHPYLVMPFCPSSAEAFIGNMGQEYMWRFIHDVSTGLAYLHEHNVVHRDIKPDNILMNTEGKFLISDFGISTKIRSTLRRNSTRDVSASSSGGSLPYMGPEMFSSRPEAVKATDIWAFGASLYELLTGELPFMGQGGVMQLNGAALPVMDGVDPDAAYIVRACMAKETWDRPTAAQIGEYAAAKVRGENPVNPWGPHVKNHKKGTDKAGKCKTDTSTSEVARKRNWFVVMWIWLMMAGWLTVSAMLFYWEIWEWNGPAVARVFISCCIVALFGLWHLWRKRQIGFWICLGTGGVFVAAALMSGETFDVCIVPLLSILILFLVLQIKKDSVSAWKVRGSGSNAVIDFTLSAVVTVGLLAAVWLTPGKLTRDARRSLYLYELAVNRCQTLIERGSQSDPEPLVDARAVLDNISDMEDRYSEVNDSYNQYTSLIESFRQKAKPIAESWAAAAAAQNMIGNTFNALSFYKTAIALYETKEMRDAFESIAGRYGFIRPIELEFAGNDGDFGSPVAREGLRYLKLRLKYEPLDANKSHNVDFKVKIFKDGILSKGNESGFTYVHSSTIDPEASDWYILFPGWGHNDSQAYSSTDEVKAEVWCGDTRLISETLTLR
ncbi:MAG TPA: serine/threonine protein kinase [Candidatus Coprenecus pullistercoris]|nr:serine/threonine protein kinase [Candidatus Coprenecus pullistercoris]